MAAKIEDPVDEASKKKNPRPILKNKLEGCSDIVNQARSIPHEDAVITVSDDRYILKLNFKSWEIFTKINFLLAISSLYKPTFSNFLGVFVYGLSEKAVSTGLVYVT
jgi:hypothetical protein